MHSPSVFGPHQMIDLRTEHHDKFLPCLVTTRWSVDLFHLEDIPCPDWPPIFQTRCQVWRTLRREAYLEVQHQLGPFAQLLYLQNDLWVRCRSVMSTSLVHIIVTAVFCFVLISFRCGYRLLSKCHHHSSCHRTWHQDDAWMAIAVLPLAGRSIGAGLFMAFQAPDASSSRRVLAVKLLLASRIFYAALYACLSLIARVQRSADR